MPAEGGGVYGAFFFVGVIVGGGWLLLPGGGWLMEVLMGVVDSIFVKVHFRYSCVIWLRWCWLVK